jgi:hypothetical protein
MINLDFLFEPPCEIELTKILNDPDIQAAESERLAKIQQEQSYILFPDRNRYFLPAGNEVYGVNGRVRVGDCIINIYVLPKGVASRLGVKLWSYHEALNTYFIERARIACKKYPPKIYNIVSNYEYSIKIYNKITTKKSSTFYVKLSDGSLSPIPLRFFERNGVAKNFTCDLSDDFYKLNTEDNQIESKTFTMQAKVVHRVFANGDNFISGKDSEFTINKKTNVRLFYSKTFKFGDALNQEIAKFINTKFVSFLKQNSYRGFYPNQIETTNQPDVSKDITCADDCGREQKFTFVKRTQVQKSIITVDKSPPHNSRYVYYIQPLKKTCERDD